MNLSVTFINTLPILDINLNQSSITSCPRKQMVHFLHINTCSWNRIRKCGYLYRKGKSSYWSNNALNFGSSAHQKCVTDFYFLQAAGTWYILKHSPNALEDTLDCVVVTYGPPEGDISSITIQATDTRWVHSIECLFTAILSR
jgi:hypothetical protein